MQWYKNYVFLHANSFSQSINVFLMLITILKYAMETYGRIQILHVALMLSVMIQNMLRYRLFQFVTLPDVAN